MIKKQLRVQRYFSEEFKKAKVKEIEQGLIKISDLSKIHEVSHVSIYRWIEKYSIHLKKGTRQVIEMKSESKKNELLQKKIEDLERIIGQKQLKIDFLEKMIEIRSNELGIDLKKNFSASPLTGSEQTEKRKGTK